MCHSVKPTYIQLMHVHSTLMQLSLNLCALMQAWCDNKAFDTVIHPIPKCVIFLEDLLQEMVDKKSEDHLEQPEWPEKHSPRSGISFR